VGSSRGGTDGMLPQDNLGGEGSTIDGSYIQSVIDPMFDLLEIREDDFYDLFLEEEDVNIVDNT
jgi:hypothetical protein